MLMYNHTSAYVVSMESCKRWVSLNAKLILLILPDIVWQHSLYVYSYHNLFFCFVIWTAISAWNKIFNIKNYNFNFPYIVICVKFLKNPVKLNLDLLPVEQIVRIIKLARILFDILRIISNEVLSMEIKLLKLVHMILKMYSLIYRTKRFWK